MEHDEEIPERDVSDKGFLRLLVYYLLRNLRKQYWKQVAHGQID